MERDARLLEAAEADSGWAPVLRLFRFRPAGITLGRAQDPMRTLDLGRCAADGIAWSVRPTGGRAVFHDAEWTYSFTARRDDPVWGGSLENGYQRIASWIVGSLVRLGVPAEIAGERRSVRGPRGGPCFATTTRHEIVLDGRKLVGSAQRRAASAWIQQGSLLLGPGHARLADYLPLDLEARVANRRRLELQATDAARYLGVDPPIEWWAAALAASLPGVRRIQDLPAAR